MLSLACGEGTLVPAESDLGRPTGRADSDSKPEDEPQFEVVPPPARSCVGSACGGDVAGTWELTAECLDPSIGGNGCLSVDISFRFDGAHITFLEDGTYRREAVGQVLSSTRFECFCPEGVADSCTKITGGCQCIEQSEVDRITEGTWSTDSNRLFMDGVEFQYCAAQHDLWIHNDSAIGGYSLVGKR